MQKGRATIVGYKGLDRSLEKVKDENNISFFHNSAFLQFN